MFGNLQLLHAFSIEATTAGEILIYNQFIELPLCARYGHPRSPHFQSVIMYKEQLNERAKSCGGKPTAKAWQAQDLDLWETVLPQSRALSCLWLPDVRAEGFKAHYQPSCLSGSLP